MPGKFLKSEKKEKKINLKQKKTIASFLATHVTEKWGKESEKIQKKINSPYNITKTIAASNAVKAKEKETHDLLDSLQSWYDAIKKEMMYLIKKKKEKRTHLTHTHHFNNHLIEKAQKEEEKEIKKLKDELEIYRKKIEALQKQISLFKGK